MAHADQVVFGWINGRVGAIPLLDGAAEWVVSDYLVPVGLVLTLLAMWFVGVSRAARERHQIGVLVALSSMAIASGAVMLINSFYFRERPFVDMDVTLLFYQPTDSSFPANSAAAAFAIAAAVWGANRRVGSVLLGIAGLYGLTRVYAGVHYPLDIVGGAAIGIAVAYVVYKLKDVLEPIPTAVIRAARILCLA